MFFFLFYYVAVSTKHRAHGLLGALLLLSLLTRSVAAVDVPATVDWRDAMVPVKDQGGACGMYPYLVLFVNVLHSIL
jgi:hypothetical protein